MLDSKIEPMNVAMRYSYDPKADALYIRFNENRYLESDEVKPGVIFDYDRAGNVIGIEMLNASKVLPKEMRTPATRRRLKAMA